ncbi:MAG: FlgD immunoglobulin-like domain containing protein [Gemmatimonadaceae bacterium]
MKAYFESQASCLGGNAVVRLLDGTSLTWTYSSTPATDVPNGSVSLGTLKPLDYNRRSALHLYDVILGGYDWATAQGGSPSGPWLVNVQWQSGVPKITQYDRDTNFLSVDGQFSVTPGDLRPDEWDDSILLHEYGHKLAAIFAFDDPAMRDQPQHYANSEDSCSTSPGGPPAYRCGNLAWAEGVAQYLSCAKRAVQRTTDLDVNATWTTRDSFTVDLETGSVRYNNVDRPNSPVVDKGWTWETAVAGALWDIYDSVNDNIKNASCGDTFNSGGALVWDGLVNHGATVVHNANDFWAVLCSRNPSVSSSLSSVYCAHGMITVGCEGLVAVDPTSDPQRLALSIAPNPFRGRATIECVIPTANAGVHNSLVIYDVTGRTIKRFGGEMLVVGRHRLVWDGRTSDGGAAPTGLYFCHLTTASGDKSAAMLMIR